MKFADWRCDSESDVKQVLNSHSYSSFFACCLSNSKHCCDAGWRCLNGGVGYGRFFKKSMQQILECRPKVHSDHKQNYIEFYCHPFLHLMQSWLEFICSVHPFDTEACHTYAHPLSVLVLWHTLPANEATLLTWPAILIGICS